MAEVLDFFGVHRTQAQVALVLRPSLPAYGMSPYGIPAYAESVGMRAVEGVEGSPELLKGFISNGLPIIVADQVSVQDRVRHFRPIDGYDDAQSYFVGSDPYLGPDHRISYTEFDQIWQISQRRFIVIYPPAQQPLVDAILSRYWDRSAAYAKALEMSQQQIARNPSMGWGWMGLADAQIETGNSQSAVQSLEKASALGLGYEAHWLQLKLKTPGS